MKTSAHGLASVLVALALLTGCADAPEHTGITPPQPSFAVDLTPPEAPSDLGYTVVEKNGPRVTLTVTWTDNSAWADEFVTCFTFTGSANTTQCAYAADYGSGTGPRSATVVVPKGNYQMRARAIRWGPETNTITIHSEYSAPIDVCADTHGCP